MNDFMTELLNLPKTKVLNYKITNETIYIYIESTEQKVMCRKCGRETKSKGLGQEIKLRHLPILGKSCYLIIKPKRGICEYCDDAPTTNQQLDWYDYKSRYTKDYENHILFSLVILISNKSLFCFSETLPEFLILNLGLDFSPESSWVSRPSVPVNACCWASYTTSPTLYKLSGYRSGGGAGAAFSFFNFFSRF